MIRDIPCRVAHDPDHGARQSDQGMWMCFFGLDIYDWIDLGDADIQQRRGCAGCYALPAGGDPATATRAISAPIIVPNLHPLDPFGP
jgi:hypothetical protein